MEYLEDIEGSTIEMTPEEKILVAEIDRRLESDDTVYITTLEYNQLTAIHDRVC